MIYKRTLRYMMPALLLVLSSLCNATEDIYQLSWLSGCWAVEGEERGTVEHWMPPAGGSMLGMARTVKRGATTGFEFLRLEFKSNGQLIYTAQPSGQAITSFLATTFGVDALVLENPEHDFPQRIVYKLKSADRLAVRVEGRNADELRGFDMVMTRTSCQVTGVQ